MLCMLWPEQAFENSDAHQDRPGTLDADAAHLCFHSSRSVSSHCKQTCQDPPQTAGQCSAKKTDDSATVMTIRF
ncbi:hypothetical protein DAI22_02g113300 [Oryza sativa Japonica Group]|nr:hypothetical protein DAI22_02g113300 [Oryza sativa Japonica Group]